MSRLLIGKVDRGDSLSLFGIKIGNSADSPATGSVTLDDIVPIPAFTVVANATAASASPTAVSMNSIPGYATQATAAATTTLTNLSVFVQAFTGATTQICKLPVVTTLKQAGWAYWIVNDSSGAVTINSSGSNPIQVVAAGARALVFNNKITADTTAAAWEVIYVPAALAGTLVIASGKTATINNTLTFAGIDGTLMTFPPASASVGYLNVPGNPQSANYTTVLADSGKSIDHPATDNNARTFTIDSNANVAYPVGTCIGFSNMDTNALSIAITTDTMYLAGAGTTGTRSLAQFGGAVARKLTTTTWLISGTNLT